MKYKRFFTQLILGLFIGSVLQPLITITNEAGNTVCKATVNTSVQQQVLIPLARLPSGTYTITFSNERGWMWGEFRKLIYRKLPNAKIVTK